METSYGADLPPTRLAAAPEAEPAAPPKRAYKRRDPGTRTPSAPAGTDPEVAAMAFMLEALDPLDPAARQRVMEWAAARFMEPG